MTYFHLTEWKGQFNSPEVLRRIRRKITGSLAGGNTVLVFDDVEGMSDAARAEIRRGWPETKVSFSFPHPELAGKPFPQPKRKRL